MPIKVTNVNDGLKIKIDSDYNTTSLFSGSKKRYITLNTGSTISIATQDTYGVVRGSDSIIIENGRVKIAPSVLENILEGAATQEWVIDQGYITSANLNAILVPYATKEWVEDNFSSGGGDPSNYATKSWVENSATAYNAARLGGYAAIDYPRKAENAVITGKWTFADNLTAGGNVGTPDFVSQMQGWRVTPQGQADFRHIYTDELQAKAFTADISQALVGSDILTKSVAKLAQNFKIGANDTYAYLYVEELEGYPGMSVFSKWDKLRLRVFDRSGGGLVIADVWVTVTDHNINDTVNNIQKYAVRFDDDGGVAGSDVYAGSMILDYGQSGSGVIERTVLDQQGSPYSRVSTWTGSPDNPANYTLHYQSGNLNGIANAEGWGVYSENSFLTGKLLVGDLTKQGQFMEYKDGELSIKGKITVTGGNAATKANVDTAVDNIEVGGRNLVEKTNQGITNIQIDSSAGGGTWTTSEEIVDGVRCAKGTKNTTAVETWSLFNLRIYTPSKFRANQQYAISFKMKPSFAVSNKTIRLSTNTNQALSTDSDTYSLLAGVWNHVKLVVTTLPDFDTILAGRGTVHLRLGIEGNSSTGDTVLLKDIKIEEGNKATDWSPAPEDVTAEINTAKQEALTAAFAAQTTANIANTAVGNLNTYVDGAFKDGVIDAAEAKAIEKYKNTLDETMAKAEASYNKVYANTYLEGSAKTSLLNAKINLWGQKDTLLSAINTAISGGTTTPAQKIAVDNAFGTFNTLMNAFQNAIEEANKAIQAKLDDIAKGYVDAVQIGGVNLLKGTNKEITIPYQNTSKQTEYVNVERGKQYALSFDVKATGNYQGNTLLVQYYDADDTRLSFEWIEGSVTTQYQRLSKIITIPTDPALVKVSIGYRSTTPAGQANTFKCLKLEKGNKATDWTPAPEDVPSALDYLATAIQDGSTDIEGGLINTNVLMVKDTNGKVRGGISGLKNDNIGFWTGGTYQAAINNNANVIFRKDGSFSLAGGKISGTKEGDVTIDGSLITQHITTNYIEGLDLNFSKGKVGGFNIDSGSLTGGSAGDRVALYPTSYIAFLSGDGYKWAGLGNNVFPTTTLTHAVGRFYNHRPTQVGLGDNIGVYIDVKGAGSIGSTDFNKNGRNMALYVENGDIYIRNGGIRAVREYFAITVSGTVYNYLPVYRSFKFNIYSTGAASYNEMRLPTKAQVESHFGTDVGISFDVLIVCNYESTKPLRIAPNSGVELKNANGDSISYHSMNRGDTVKIIFLNNHWQISAIYSESSTFQYFYSPNGLHGLRIDDQGIYIRKNGGAWTPL